MELKLVAGKRGGKNITATLGAHQGFLASVSTAFESRPESSRAFYPPNNMPERGYYVYLSFTAFILLKASLLILDILFKHLIRGSLNNSLLFASMFQRKSCDEGLPLSSIVAMLDLVKAAMMTWWGRAHFSWSTPSTQQSKLRNEN